MKGQITIVNLIAVLLTIFVYFAMLPILNTFIDNTVVSLQNNPNEYTDMQITLMYMLPFVMLLMIILSGLNMAIPRREGFG